jgi:hypothetical protein
MNLKYNVDIQTLEKAHSIRRMWHRGSDYHYGEVMEDDCFL